MYAKHTVLSDSNYEFSDYMNSRAYRRLDSVNETSDSSKDKKEVWIP
jgi:dipeptidase